MLMELSSCTIFVPFRMLVEMYRTYLVQISVLLECMHQDVFTIAFRSTLYTSLLKFDSYSQSEEI